MIRCITEHGLPVGTATSARCDVFFSVLGRTPPVGSKHDAPAGTSMLITITGGGVEDGAYGNSSACAWEEGRPWKEGGGVGEAWCAACASER